MTHPRIVVLGLDPASSRELAARWRPMLRAEFVPVGSVREMLEAVDQRSVDCLVIDRSAVTDTGARAVIVAATKYPHLPLVCWRGVVTERVGEGTDAQAPATVVGIETDEALVEFLNADVCNVARGRLSGVSLPSVLQVLQMEQRTCRMRVRVRGIARFGELFVRAGTLIHAVYAGRTPRDAALELLSWVDADVAFDRLAASTPTTLHDPMDFLLLESARVRDERAQAHDADAMRLASVGGARASASSAQWLLPPDLRGDSRVLVREVCGVSGCIAAAVVDTQLQVLAAYQSNLDERTPKIHAAAAELFASLEALLTALELPERTEDMLVTLARRYVLLRALPASPNLLLVGVFDRASTTLGLVRAHFSRLALAFNLSSELA